MSKFNEHLHVVAFDVPYPANYGGVIDIFYKVKALHQLGVKIHLHCYQYGREESKELNQFCHSVHYYPRRTFRNPFYGKLPYIVATRNTTELITRLGKDKYPILFEGLHCTYFLNHPSLKDRFKIVRTHNVEHDYYRKLEEVETNFFKKYFFRIESERLKKHESVLKHADLVAAISPADVQHFSRKYEPVIYLPAFHPNMEMRSENGRGDYAFYHGNLGVGENDEAAKFLVNEVFNQVDTPLIIAGNNPSRELRRSVQGRKNIQLMANLSSEDMLNHVRNAHVNILPTFQSTGIKLKLVNALFLGRHCLVNNTMVQNTGLEGFCELANTPKQFVKQLKRLKKEDFSLQDLAKRRSFLEERFCNIRNAEILMEAIHSAKK